MNWTDGFIGPFGWAEQVAAKSRETLACDPMNFGANVGLPQLLIWAGNPRAALQAVEEAENKGLSHPWLEGRRDSALLAGGRIDDPAVQGPGPQGGDMDFDRQILREALAGDPAALKLMLDVLGSLFSNWPLIRRSGKCRFKRASSRSRI